MNKKSTKQTRKEQTKKRRAAQERSRQRDTHRLMATLERQAEPILRGVDLEDNNQFVELAVRTMTASADLYDEPEFADIEFAPADAMVALTDKFELYVPSPDELEKLPEEEQGDLTSEAFMRAVATFVSPELQKDLLQTLERCRARLASEKQEDKLALAAMTELLLRDDRRPEIWGTCGILHRAMSAALEEAYQLQAALDPALEAAKSVDPEVEDYEALIRDSSAYKAYREEAAKIPGATEYLDRIDELEPLRAIQHTAINNTIANALFEPDEIWDIADKFMEHGEEQGLFTSNTEEGILDNPAKLAEDVAALPNILQKTIQDTIPPERFQTLLVDLRQFRDEIEEDENDLLARVEALLNELENSPESYSQSQAFHSLILNAAVDDILNGEDEDEDDEEFEDDSEDDEA